MVRLQISGAKVGLIVYSDQRKNLTIDYSWNLRPVERGLVTFYGGGTVFPARDFVRLAEMEPHRPKHFCLISDTEITNIDDAADRLGDALEVHPENSGSVFLIDQDRNHKAELIRAVGSTFSRCRGERTWYGWWRARRRSCTWHEAAIDENAPARFY